MKINYLPTILTLIFLYSCVVLNPLFKPNQIYKPVDISGDYYLSVNGKKSDKLYTLRHYDGKKFRLKEKGKIGLMSNYINCKEIGSLLTFGKIKEREFCEAKMIIDFFKDSVTTEEVSTIWKFSRTDSSISFTLFDVEQVIKKEKLSNPDIKYTALTDKSSEYNMGTSYRLEAGTLELQELVLKYYNDKDVFADKNSFTFIKNNGL